MSDLVLVDIQDRIAILTLNRPEALNALNTDLLAQLNAHAEELSRNPDIGCLIITGSEKAFAAGADVKEMADKSQIDMLMSDFFGRYNSLSGTRLPVIAAVNGFSLGGGCELAMMCDMIFAADTAKFGQPEIKLGIMPGMGGTQRMAHAVGKAKAMDMILTGRMMDAEEAERCGLVARIIPAADLMSETIKAAKTIASYSRPSVVTAKEAVNRAFETTLTEGLHYEQRVFYALFATEDQKEGMAAFAEKRKPNFKHK
ncbi:enoyl-CoA hydratase [Pararhizobium sp. IMCC21322]|uniref:enoyl-CoA hydratase n=1 Tax=Pararhizobium sp. IMCC21322 TaxID=3067903 RepID=UPI002741B705|nr:enoyl-CoA hydratase [Pararhizobium sp. IMCC21322]